MMALQAYRHLLRATRVAFEGDWHLMHAARSQARTGFETLRDVDSSSPEAKKGIQHAEGVAEVLTKNLVQGKQVEGRDALKLRIHKGTERGDNDTVKHPLGKGGVVKVGGI